MTQKSDPSVSSPRSLDDSDIEDVAQPSRRSALAAVGAAVAGAVFGAVMLSPSEAEACRRRTGRTDADPQDGAGRGRTGLTDSDSGDEAQCGRGGGSRARNRRRTCTDSDSGAGSDPPNHPC
jgi:hypothetical protein